MPEDIKHIISEIHEELDSKKNIFRWQLGSKCVRKIVILRCLYNPGFVCMNKELMV